MPLVLYCGCGGCRVGASLLAAGEGFVFGIGSGFGDGGFIPTRRDGPSPPDLPPSSFAFFGMLVAAMVGAGLCSTPIVVRAPSRPEWPEPPPKEIVYREMNLLYLRTTQTKTLYDEMRETLTMARLTSSTRDGDLDDGGFG